MNTPPGEGSGTRSGTSALASSTDTVHNDSRAVASVIVPNRVESIRPVVAFIVQMSRVLKVAASNPLFEAAVAEALANAVKHGRDSHFAEPICCELALSDTHFLLRVIDGRKEFVVPEAPALPDVDPSDVDKLPESGYGLPIILSVFSSVRPIVVQGRFGLELGLPLVAEHNRYLVNRAMLTPKRPGSLDP